MEDAKLLAKIERLKHARRCPFPGVDVEYSVTENGLTDFHLAVKFKKLLGDHEAVSEIAGTQAALPTPTATDAEEGTIVAVVTEDNTAPVELDDSLIYAEQFYRVVSVEGNVVQMVRGIGDPGAPIEIDRALATRLVNEYIS